MGFSDLVFVAFFLPLFLFIYYRPSGVKARNGILLVFSLIFYAWSGLMYVPLLVAMSAVGWLGGRRIAAAKKGGKKGRGALVLTLVILIGVLAVFKYTGFAFREIGRLTGTALRAPAFAMPLGISFYTFRLISYDADVYTGKTKAEKSFWLILLYTSVFHNITEGPIVRYTEIRDELRARRGDWSDFTDGMYRFICGLFMKTVFANHCGELAEAVLPVGGNPGAVPVSGVWLGMGCYMLQIYLDFAAYSDMAIGLGRMAGFHYPENFNYPYTAVSVRDFWRRWHISLSAFFRDYVYIPLGGSRKGAGRTVRNLLVVWALTGFWHGAGWNYLVWGLWFFVFICIENFLRHRVKRKMPAAAGHIYTLLVVFLSWIFFRYTDFGEIAAVLRGLVGANGNALTGAAVRITLRNNIFFLAAAVLLATPALRNLGRWLGKRAKNGSPEGGLVYAAELAGAAALLGISVLAMVGSSYMPFLYKQF